MQRFLSSSLVLLLTFAAFYMTHMATPPDPGLVSSPTTTSSTSTIQMYDPSAQPTAPLTLEDLPYDPNTGSYLVDAEALETLARNRALNANIEADLLPADLLPGIAVDAPNVGRIIEEHTASEIVAPPIDADPYTLQAYVQTIAASEYGWHGQQWDDLVWLLNEESTWRADVRNPGSTAAGLFQFLSSTARIYGIDHPSTTGRFATVSEQTRAGLLYISDRYGDPTSAKARWLWNCRNNPQLRFPCFY